MNRLRDYVGFRGLVRRPRLSGALAVERERIERRLVRRAVAVPRAGGVRPVGALCQRAASADACRPTLHALGLLSAARRRAAPGLSRAAPDAPRPLNSATAARRSAFPQRRCRRRSPSRCRRCRGSSRAANSACAASQRLTPTAGHSRIICGISGGIGGRPAAVVRSRFLNYRHAFHAGSFADVHKHAVLCRILHHLRGKPAPFRVIDSHAGAGLYDLAGPRSRAAPANGMTASSG